MKIVITALFFFAFFCQNSYAVENYILSPQEGAFLTYFERSSEFKNETTKYKYFYEALIDKNNGECRIAAIPDFLKENYTPSFFECEILKSFENLIIISKNPLKTDPYQEFYFIYPQLNIGFMVIGKANDGFSSKIPNLPSASVAAIPLTIKVK